MWHTGATQSEAQTFIGNQEDKTKTFIKTCMEYPPKSCCEHWLVSFPEVKLPGQQNLTLRNSLYSHHQGNWPTCHTEGERASVWRMWKQILRFHLSAQGTWLSGALPRRSKLNHREGVLDPYGGHESDQKEGSGRFHCLGVVTFWKSRRWRFIH